jgi:ABC-2 type transport system permease protein
MNANIYRHEFRTHLKSVLTWSLAVTGILFVYFSFFSVFADQAALMNEMMANFPQELRAAFGLDNMDLSDVLGYFSFIFLFVQLCLAIQAGNYGFGLVSIEESELTADFLLSKPVSRVQVLTSKLLAALTGLTLTNLVVWAAVSLPSASFGASASMRRAPGPAADQHRDLPAFLPERRPGRLAAGQARAQRDALCSGLGFGMYVLSAFSGVLGDVKLELITPFKHLDAAPISSEQGAYDTPLVLLNVGSACFAGVKLLAVYPPRYSGGVVRRCLVNIFFRELKANLKSLVIWSVIVILLIMIAVGKLPGLRTTPRCWQ